MPEIKKVLKVRIDYGEFFACKSLGLEGYRVFGKRGLNEHGFVASTTPPQVAPNALRVHGDITFDHFPITRQSGVEEIDVLRVDVPEAFLMEGRDAQGLHQMDHWMRSEGLRRVGPEHVIAVFKQHMGEVRLEGHMAALLENPWKGSAVHGGLFPGQVTAPFSLAICTFISQPDLNLFWETQVYEPRFDLLALPII